MGRLDFIYGIVADDDIAAFLRSDRIRGIIADVGKGPRWRNDEPFGATPGHQVESHAMPEPLQHAYGVGVGSPAAGSWLEYSVADMEAIRYELVREGHTVRREDALVGPACSQFGEHGDSNQRFVELNCTPKGDEHEPEPSVEATYDLQTIFGAVTTNANWNFSLTREAEEPDGAMRVVVAPKPNVHYVARGVDLMAVASAAYRFARIDTHPRRFFGSTRGYAGYGTRDDVAPDIAAAVVALASRLPWIARLAPSAPLNAYDAAAVTTAIDAAIAEGWFFHLSAASNRPPLQAFACHIRARNETRGTGHGSTPTGAIIRALTMLPT